MKALKDAAIAVWGAGGDWAQRRILPSLKKAGVQDRQILEIEKDKAPPKTDMPVKAAIIAVPPAAMHSCVQAALEILAEGGLILVEKPCPDPQALDQLVRKSKQNCRLAFVDHYLAKPETRRAIRGFFSRWRVINWLERWTMCAPDTFLRRLGRLPFKLRTCLQWAEIELLEAAPEQRMWVRQKTGVLADIGHHGLAILLRAYDRTSLDAVDPRTIEILEADRFPEGGLRSIRALVHVGQQSIILHAVRPSGGKPDGPTVKEIRFHHGYVLDGKAGRRQCLAGPMDYAALVEHGLKGRTHPALLDAEEAARLARLVHEIEQAAARRTPPEEPVYTTATVELLADQFKHRHHFFWWDYFRILIYQLIMLFSPLLAYGSLKLADGGAPYLARMLGVASVFLGLYAWIVQGHKTEMSLAEEHHRMKRVHDLMKQGLARRFHLDLNIPGINRYGILDTLLLQYRYIIRAASLAAIAAGIILALS